MSILEQAVEELTDRLGPVESWIDKTHPTFEKGRSALLIAAACDNHRCVELLLSLGADPAAVDAEGADAVERAVRGKSLKCLEILAKVCGTEHVNNEGDTPLIVALRAESSQEAACLAQRADPLARDREGQSAFALAALNPDTPPLLLDALAGRLGGAITPERKLVELAAAMGACRAKGNKEGAAILSERLESVVLKIELGEELPKLAASPPTTKKRL